MIQIGLVEAPNAGVYYVNRTPGAEPVGVTASLGRALSDTLGVPPEFKLFCNSGEATDATRIGAVDVSFMPVDDARRSVVEFGPAYYDLESTYLVRSESGVTDVAGVDRSGFRVLAISGTTTFRASARTLKNTQPMPVALVADAIAMIKDYRADAFALSRDTLEPYERELPYTRIVAGHFQRTSISIAVPKNRPVALAYVTEWLSNAKSEGIVSRIFAAHGHGAQTVAP